MTSKIIVNNVGADAGIASVHFDSNIQRGTSNFHSVGVELAGINVLGADTPIGTGATIYDDGGARFSGIVSATSFVGSGANLTGIDATKIETGNTKVETIDTGSDGHIKVTTEGGERLRIGPAGQIGIAGANYGTSGQVLTSAGSGSAVQWATPASGWVHTATTALNGSSTLTLTGVPDGASHIRYLIRYMSCASSTQPAFRVQKSTTGGSKSIITANYQAYAAYFGGNGTSGGGNSDRMDIFDGYSNAANNMFGTIDVYRVGTNGSDGTNYLFNHQGFVNYNGTLHACVQSNGYIELGTGSTDFISGAQFFNSNGVNFDNGHINQSYLLS